MNLFFLYCLSGTGHIDSITNCNNPSRGPHPHITSDSRCRSIILISDYTGLETQKLSSTFCSQGAFHEHNFPENSITTSWSRMCLAEIKHFTSCQQNSTYCNNPSCGYPAQIAQAVSWCRCKSIPQGCHWTKKQATCGYHRRKLTSSSMPVNSSSPL